MNKKPTRNEVIFAEYERRKNNGAQTARKFKISRQRVHQIALLEATKLGRKPKWYKEPLVIRDSTYRKVFHGEE
jgi:hypothetical protein